MSLVNPNRLPLELSSQASREPSCLLQQSSDSQSSRKPSSLASPLAFKPRQVLLAMTKNSQNGVNNKIDTLKEDQKALLLRSVAQYLESSGFSKTLKKLFFEAKIEKDEVGCSSLNLEEVFCKYLETCDHADKKIVGKELTNGTACESPVKKRKEKKKQKVKLHSESLNGKVDYHEEKPIHVLSEKKREPDYEVENTSKAKKKKKNKLSDPDDIEQRGMEKEQENEEAKQVARSEDSPVFNAIAGTAKDDIKISEHNVSCKENKGSKKRKRSASEDSTLTEKPKRRMTDISEVRDEAGQVTKIKGSMGTEAVGESNGENNQLGLISQENVDLKSSGGKALQKSTKKQCNGSVEAKKPFQRVNVDEVVFRDERLQDNSYWAKDGAETGYGAKAQEILGQVKGRGFRHEKTKKKRGSYRGGQIDIQSHSIKFDASDDE